MKQFIPLIDCQQDFVPLPRHPKEEVAKGIESLVKFVNENPSIFTEYHTTGFYMNHCIFQNSFVK